MSDNIYDFLPCERTVLHCDMNNFYASVECMLDPDLRDKAVAVCGSTAERHGIVLAKNYKAKGYGVATGEVVWQARQKCPELVIVQPHYEQYMKYSLLAREIYSRYTDLIEPYGMDECWLDVTGSSAMGTGLQIAEEIRRTVKFELGLTISIGVSFNKIFAKLGSDMKKPDAVTCIYADGFREKIWGMDVCELLGVGRATNRKLSQYGIHTIGQLAQAPDGLLKAKLGKNGLLLKRYANGMDVSPVTHCEYHYPIKSIGHGITTAQDLENSAQVWAVMLELTQEIGHKLRKHGKRARVISIVIKNDELKSKEWQCRMSMPTMSSSVIAKESYELFQRSYCWQRPIRSVTVRAIDLIESDTPYQLDMLIDFGRTENLEKLDAAVEDIRRRFGKNSIKSAVLYKNLRLPEKRDFQPMLPTGLVMQ